MAAAAQDGHARATRVLRDRFGYAEFRGQQLDIISACLHGKDVFVRMPTGGGKSLCFLIPASRSWSRP